MCVSYRPVAWIDTLPNVQPLRHPRVGVRRILESRDTKPTRALQIAGFVERRSAVLPSTRALEEYMGDSKLVVSGAFAQVHNCDGAALSVSALPVSGRARADVIVVGRPHRAQRRLRAFYVNSKMTASVHERLVPRRPGYLVRAARIMDRMRGASEIVVPYVYETAITPMLVGTARPFAMATSSYNRPARSRAIGK